ncbi:hypothetical protein pb186bvf_016206 [Paramecium bursaria]
MIQQSELIQMIQDHILIKVFIKLNTIGNTLKALGKLVEALEQYDMAIRINPNDEQHQKLLVIMNKHKKCQKFVKKINPKFIEEYTKPGRLDLRNN